MAVETFSEIQSFVSKFCHLTSIGYDADIKFSSVNGKIQVNLAAELGTLPCPPSSNKSEKPSRTKRRRRRYQARLHNVQNIQEEDPRNPTSTDDQELVSCDALKEPPDDPFTLPLLPIEQACSNQVPISCIRREEGCKNMIDTYYNEYTAICDPCSTFLAQKLTETPFSHNLCPCCHKHSSGPLLSLCAECHDDILQDGWTESQWGSWHMDKMKGKIVCIYLDFSPKRIL